MSDAWSALPTDAALDHVLDSVVLLGEPDEQLIFDAGQIDPGSVQALGQAVRHPGPHVTLQERLEDAFKDFLQGDSEGDLAAAHGEAFPQGRLRQVLVPLAEVVLDGAVLTARAGLRGRDTAGLVESGHSGAIVAPLHDRSGVEILSPAVAQEVLQGAGAMAADLPAALVITDNRETTN